MQQETSVANAISSFPKSVNDAQTAIIVSEHVVVITQILEDSFLGLIYHDF
jgi:aromatic ring-opening dioxygenase LigB subunit